MPKNIERKVSTMNSKASVGIQATAAISGNLAAIAIMTSTFHCCFMSVAEVEPLK